VKKLVYISFIVIYTLSVIGVPVYLHICTEMKSVGFEKCEMCKRAGQNEHSCCSENIDESQKKIKSNQKCCDSKPILSPLTDNYIPVEKATGKAELKITFTELTFLENILNNFSFFKFYFDSSPPPFIQDKIFISNSTFLI